MGSDDAQQQFRAWYDQLQATGGLGDPLTVATDRTSQFSMLRMAWQAAWDARGAVAARKTEAFKMAYSPDGSAEVAAEPFRAKTEPFDKKTIDWDLVAGDKRSWVRGIAERARPQHSPGLVPGYPAGPPPVSKLDDYTRVDIPAFPIQFQGTSEPGQPPSGLFGPGQQDQRYVPTTTMKALPDDTSPGFRVPRQFEAVDTVWDGHRAAAEANPGHE